MKIIHICLCDEYNEDWAYHRNIISEQNKTDGHDTYILTTAYDMNQDGGQGGKSAGVTVNKYGITVYRLPNKYPIPDNVQRKIRCVRQLRNALDEISPDIIMVHNIQTFSLGEIISYKNLHPETLLLGDSHATYDNSAKSFVSKYLINKMLYGPLVRKYYYSFDMFYYIIDSAYTFFEEVYGVKENNYNLLPLPGKFICEEDKEKNRQKIRRLHNVSDDTMLFLHSGKMNREKRTLELVQAVHSLNGKYRLIIIGNIIDDKEQILEITKEDKRIEYLGWKSSTVLSEYLSAADLYLQPGSVSITMQNSLAAGTPVMVYPHEDYKPFFAGWEILATTKGDIKNKLQTVLDRKIDIKNMSDIAYNTARRFYDCEVFAQEMYDLFLHRELIQNYKNNNSKRRLVQKREGKI